MAQGEYSDFAPDAYQNQNILETARSGFAVAGDLRIHNEQRNCLYNGKSAKKITNGSVTNLKEEESFGEKFPETNSTMSRY